MSLHIFWRRGQGVEFGPPRIFLTFNIHLGQRESWQYPGPPLSLAFWLFWAGHKWQSHPTGWHAGCTRNALLPLTSPCLPKFRYSLCSPSVWFPTSKWSLLCWPTCNYRRSGRQPWNISPLNVSLWPWSACMVQSVCPGLKITLRLYRMHTCLISSLTPWLLIVLCQLDNHPLPLLNTTQSHFACNETNHPPIAKTLL